MLKRMTLLVALARETSSLNNAWRRRGVYRDRSDMPPLDAVAAAVGAAAPWAAPKWVWAFCWRAHARCCRAPRARRPHEHLREPPGALAQGARRRRRGVRAPAARGAPSRRAAAAAVLPRLHHQNIKLRAKFLDDAVRDELRRGDDDVAVVALGAGFDGRAARAVEGRGPRARRDVDLPEVIAQKRSVLGRADGYGAELIACDLAGAGVEAALARAIANRTRVIFVVEALLIYLDAAAADGTRRVAAARRAPRCRSASRTGSRSAASTRRRALFADRGFDLVRYLPKPGLARHMGVARRRPHAELTSFLCRRRSTSPFV